MTRNEPLNPTIQRIISEHDPLRQLVGFDIVLTPQGQALVHLEIREKHLNRGGLLHGGMAPMLLTSAGALSVYAADTEVDYAANVSMNVAFLNSVKGGLVVAIGQVERMGGTLAHVRATLAEGSENGPILASAQAVYRLSRKPRRSATT